MQIWLRDNKTGIECGINADGDLFLGDDKSGFNLPDTPENRLEIVREFFWQTEKEKSPAGQQDQFE